MIRNFLRISFKNFKTIVFKIRIHICEFLNHFGIKIKFSHEYYKIDKNQYDFYKIPGFTSQNERKYLYNFIKRHYKGNKDIVELGCAFGSLSVPILKALNERKAKTSKLHVYDLFQYHESFGNILSNSKFNGKIQYGDCFKHIYMHFTEQYNDLLKINKCDLSRTGIFNGSIDLLIIDAMKSEPVANSIVNSFFPRIKKGSLIFHQDFCHYHEPWIHIIQYLYINHFIPICHIEDTSTYLFECRKEISEAEIMESNIMELQNDIIEKAFDYSLSLVTEQPANQNIMACKIFCYMFKHEFSIATKLIEKTLTCTDHIEEGNLSFVIKIADSIQNREKEIKDRYKKDKINLIDDLDFITSITYQKAV